MANDWIVGAYNERRRQIGRWIAAGYNAALAGDRPMPLATGGKWYWQRIGHELAAELAEAQLNEEGMLDPLPLPDWEELVERAIQENDRPLPSGRLCCMTGGR